jgi:periplasmic divalent cation tolerance protein
MRLLLDTHPFLWWLDGERRLSAKARRAIANDSNAILVSAVSAWEIRNRLSDETSNCWRLSGFKGPRYAAGIIGPECRDEALLHRWRSAPPSARRNTTPCRQPTIAAVCRPTLRLAIPAVLSAKDEHRLMTDAVVILTTVPAGDQGDAIGQKLVNERLAACVNILAPMTSIYRWRGAVERDTEHQVVIKTTVDRVPALRSRLATLHPYELPEFIVLRVADGGEEYLKWIGRASSEA